MSMNKIIPEGWQFRAYTDGSYIQGEIRWGFHGEAFNPETDDVRPVVDRNGAVTTETNTRHIAGEIAAVSEVVRFCEEYSIDSVEICYDYTGVRHWAEGTWKRNKPVTKAYYRFMQQNNNVSITWVKVKAHSGNEGNERADRLARGEIAEGDMKKPSGVHETDSHITVYDLMNMPEDERDAFVQESLSYMSSDKSPDSESLDSDTPGLDDNYNDDDFIVDRN